MARRRKVTGKALLSLYRIDEAAIQNPAQLAKNLVRYPKGYCVHLGSNYADVMCARCPWERLGGDCSTIATLAHLLHALGIGDTPDPSKVV